MDCQGPQILEETWEKIKNQTWVGGGWEIDGVMHWIAKDHPGTGGRVAWHVWADEGHPTPDHLVRCFFPEDAWRAVAGGELLREDNCIRQRRTCFCLVSPEGDAVEIMEWPLAGERG